MATLTSATIISNSFKTVYDLITGASGVSDPASRSIARNTWVFPSFPDVQGSKFPNYPIITIDVDIAASPYEMGKTGRTNQITVTFGVFTSKSEDLDTVSDDVNNILNTLQSTTEAAGMYMPKITNTAKTVVFREKGKVHMRTILVQYRNEGL